MRRHPDDDDQYADDAAEAEIHRCDPETPARKWEDYLANLPDSYYGLGAGLIVGTAVAVVFR